jgi:hypothetical protein
MDCEEPCHARQVTPFGDIFVQQLFPNASKLTLGATYRQFSITYTDDANYAAAVLRLSLLILIKFVAVTAELAGQRLIRISPQS